MFEAVHVPGFPIPHVLHFASGVLWKAAAQTWWDGTRQLSRCRMGPYEEDFRRYLLGVGPFPECARLALQVVSDTPSLNTILSPYKNRWGEGWKHTFAIPGLIFVMFIGKSRPPAFENVSPGSLPIFLAPGVGNQLFANALALPRKVKALGELRHRVTERGRSQGRPQRPR